MLDQQTALARYQKADEIIADYESQYSYTLPTPWRETVTALLLQGLSDPDLHRIFNTILRVEFEAGRLEERPVDHQWQNDE